MAVLSKEQIYNAKDSEITLVDVPEWDDQLTQEQREKGEHAQIYIARMSGNAKDAWEASCVGKNGGPNFINLRAKLVAACVVDEEGNRYFKDEKDIVKVSNKSAKALDRIIAATEKLNKLSNTDYEDLAKN